MPGATAVGIGRTTIAVEGLAEFVSLLPIRILKVMAKKKKQWTPDHRDNDVFFSSISSIIHKCNIGILVQLLNLFTKIFLLS